MSVALDPDFVHAGLRARSACDDPLEDTILLELSWKENIPASAKIV
jgi:hypothetical protein